MTVIDQCKTCGSVRIEKKWLSPEEFLLEGWDEKLGDNVSFKKKQCKRCEVVSANYFEGNFQLRNIDSKSFPKAIDFINDYMRIQEDKERAFVVKVMEKSEGLDLFLSSRKVLVQLGKAVFDEFGGELKVSKKLFSKNKQTSKEVYRVTVLVRLPDVNIRDVLFDEDEKTPYQVKKYSKSNIITENLITAKRKIINGNDVKNYEIISTFYKVMVSRYKPNIEIIEPFDFQNIQIENQDKAKEILKEKKSKKKIRVFEHDDRWFCAE